MKGFRIIGGAQRFPPTFSGISHHFRPHRYLTTAPEHRVEISVCFTIWDACNRVPVLARGLPVDGWWPAVWCRTRLLGARRRPAACAGCRTWSGPRVIPVFGAVGGVVAELQVGHALADQMGEVVLGGGAEDPGRLGYLCRRLIFTKTSSRSPLSPGRGRRQRSPSA